ncbi:MAG: threonine synthase [Alphaproteobacteria bacterium]|nr:MAG: threonine synthase [Alphaproteobacteria bacterium]
MEKNYVSHLECSITGKKYEANKIHGLSDVGRPLLVRYDLQTLKKEVSRDDIKNSKVDGLWRYSPLLPVLDPKDRVTLGETITPLIELNRTVNYSSKDKGVVLVKDEGRLPTGSFKARGLCLAVSMAKQFKLKHLAIPTNGNAGAAMAAYATNAGIKSTVFCPEDTPEINIREIQSLGAETFLVNGLINDCGKIVGEGKEKVGWFDVSTLKEPYRIEGKKTMGLELAEQLNWELPDVIFYPTGGGTGLIGMWKAFLELKELGWINGKLPKMVAVQATGCAPIVKAWENGDEHAPLWENAYTKAAGIRVPIAVGDFLIIRAIRESKGFAMSVSDEEIFEARDRVASNDGCFLCPEGAATMTAYEKALSSKLISKDDNVVLFNCATGLKYPLPEVSNKIDKNNEIDYKTFINYP